MEGLSTSMYSWKKFLHEEFVLLEKKKIPPLARSALLGEYFLKISSGQDWEKNVLRW